MKLSVSFVFISWNERQKHCWKQEFFSLLQRVVWQRFPIGHRHPPYTSLLLSFAAFLTPEGFSQFKNQREKKKRRSRGGWTGRGLGHKAWVFNTSFQTLVAGLILLLFGLLWYFLSSFMDPWGLFTCDITETLSSQDCVYLVDVFDCILPTTRSNTPRSLVVFGLPLTCLGVPIQGKCAKAKTALA